MHGGPEVRPPGRPGLFLSSDHRGLYSREGFGREKSHGRLRPLGCAETDQRGRQRDLHRRVHHAPGGGGGDAGGRPFLRQHAGTAGEGGEPDRRAGGGRSLLRHQWCRRRRRPFGGRMHGGIKQRASPSVARHRRDEGRGHRPKDADQLLRAHDSAGGSQDRTRRSGQSCVSVASGGGLHSPDGCRRSLSRLFAPHRSAHRSGHRTGAWPRGSR